MTPPTAHSTSAPRWEWRHAGGRRGDRVAMSAFFGFIVGLLLAPAAAFSQVVDTDLWGVGLANVTAVVRVENTLYVGGVFSLVGPNTGSGIPLGYGQGAATEGYAKVNGEILTVVSDGSGGWYIGGDFTAVGGHPRLHLAHVLADGQVAEWSPNPDGQVRSLALSQQTLYVGGRFSNIATRARNRVAAFDAATGELTEWNPSATGTLYTVGGVAALAVRNDTVYVGGNFTAMGGQARSCLATVDGRSGQVLPWNPNPDFEVNTIALDGGTAFLGGGFARIGGRDRYLVAAVDLASGFATNWDARIGNRRREYWEDAPTVKTLMVRDGTVYIGGLLDSLGGQYRSGLGAVRIQDGQVTAWDPRVSGAYPGTYVRALAARGDTIYAGGYFSTVGGVPRICLAGLSASTAVPTEWNPKPNDEVDALALDADHIYVGGYYHTLGPWQVRNNLAALDLTTGRPTDWNPDPNGIIVYALKEKDGIVYAGGEFTHIGGQARSWIAALDAVSGMATAWNPGANGAVRVIAMRGDTLYVGGWFTRIGGQPRRYLAALSGATGLATEWDPKSDGIVSAIVVNGNTVYLGGNIGSIGGERRVGLGAADASTGVVTPWRADADGWVESMTLNGDALFVAGYFDSIANVPRTSLAALDATSGAVLAWNPSPLRSPDATYGPPRMHAIASLGHEIYVGGQFTGIGGRAWANMAALDDSLGLATEWNPDPREIVWSLYTSGSTLYVGGKFRTIGGLPTAGMAAVAFPPLEVPAAPLLALSQSAPNPTRTTAIIHFSLPNPGPVTLEVFDVQGRRVATLLAREPHAAGDHNVLVRAEQWGAGAYFYRLEAAGRTTTRKMLVVK